MGNHTRVLLAGIALAAVSSFVWGMQVVRWTRFQAELRTESSCVGCHAVLQPTLVAETRHGGHAEADVRCEDCHGTDHEQIIGVRGAVSAAACAAACHTDVYASFQKSKHSQPKVGLKADLLKHMPDEVGGCTFTRGCHAVRQPYEDGSSGKCSVCHPSHSFDLAVSRDPAVCVTCHSGSNNTEVTEYEKSIHGVLYRVGGEKVGGPTCVTCHMPDGRHDDGFNLTDVQLRVGEAPLRFVHTMSPEAFEEKRHQMVAVCKPCHGVSLVRKALREADEFRKKGAYTLELAAHIIHDLYEEGILDPMPADRRQNPIAGPDLYLGPNQLFDSEMSAAERIFYRMYMFTYSAGWRRAFHNLPALVMWHENEMMKEDLIMLKAEAAKLRALARSGGIVPKPPGGLVGSD